MAKFVLGAVITNIAGSVGGTTFRRVKNGFSMMNKIKGASTSKLLQNTRVPQIANIFQRWALLEESERAGWNNAATLFTFPDKFGVPKNLTGRELFNKSNIQLLPMGLNVVDASDFNTTTIPYVFEFLELDATGELFAVTLNSSENDNSVMISVEVSNKQIYQPTFKSRKVIKIIVTDAGSETQPITDEIMLNFPYIKAGMWVAVYTQAVNAYGMVSPYQALIGQVV